MLFRSLALRSSVNRVGSVKKSRGIWTSAFHNADYLHVATGTPVHKHEQLRESIHARLFVESSLIRESLDHQVACISYWFVLLETEDSSSVSPLNHLHPLRWPKGAILGQCLPGNPLSVNRRALNVIPPPAQVHLGEHQGKEDDNG